MSRKANPNGNRIQRENQLASALGLGTGRSLMMAMLSAYESGARVQIRFFPTRGDDGDFTPLVTYATQKAPAVPQETETRED